MGIALLAITGLEGSGDPEKVMPMVLQEYLPAGLRGMVIAGLLAAFMSTFSATVNAAASYIVRDLWQPLTRHSDQKSLVRASYVATASVVLAGTAIGFNADSIRQIWDWLMLALGAAYVFPNVLRWYWWRLNGWGYAAGTLAGLAGAVPILFWTLLGEEEPPLYQTFPALCSISLFATLAGTWLTKPTDTNVLIAFYRTVRPFGRWGPIRAQSELTHEESSPQSENLTLAMTNVFLASIVILGCYLGPMYLVGHWHVQATISLAVAGVAGVLLYFTWYRNLPPSD
jgi:Na+/proline symporter